VVPWHRRVQDRLGSGAAHLPGQDGLKIFILIAGGTKKRQQQDIDQAVALWEGLQAPQGINPERSEATWH